MRVLSLIALSALPAVSVAAALAQAGFEFMPDGGRGTLSRLIEAGHLPAERLAGPKTSEQDWSTILAKADPALEPRTLETLASYLAANMPEQLGGGGELPADGKELAIENCQFCHSFFTGYLVHDRDTEGWRAIFKSPFHRELPMSAPQRETFARYSAINMPIPFEDVPEELRF
jgi:hypothetical protein